MNINQNQHIFKEFQKSVDQARLLAQKLGPEHFYLAYDICAKLQEVIFKRACGYCFLSENANESHDLTNHENTVESQINPKIVAKNICLSLPSFSLCGPGFPLIISGQSAVNTKPDSRIHKLIRLKQFTEIVPSEEEETLLCQEGNVIKDPSLSINGSLTDILQSLSKYFPDCVSSQYELCLPQKANPVLLVPLIDEFPQIHNAFQSDSCVFLRPMQSSNKAMKIESSMPSPAFNNTDNVARINSFMADNDKTPMSDESVVPELSEGSVFPETIFSSDVHPVTNMDISISNDGKSRSTRRYNWSVVLSNLHENHPTQLRNESVRFPDVCHELHAIPPTPQKLRPTKRCQLCLKGYKSRKESRYYCRPCDKGFHIKCFEVYHHQLGYGHYKVKIISGER